MHKKMANAHSLCHLTYLTIGLGVEDDGRGMFAGATRTVGLLFLWACVDAFVTNKSMDSDDRVGA